MSARRAVSATGALAMGAHSLFPLATTLILSRKEQSWKNTLDYEVSKTMPECE
jgi:hypothetical protein